MSERPVFIRRLLPGLAAAAALAAIVAARAPREAAAACDPANGGLTLPAGFCASLFSDGVAGARHMVVAPNGDVLVNTRPRGGGQDAPAPAAGVVILRDANRDGKAELKQRITDGSPGTGIALSGGHLYATSGNAIVRFPYRPGTTASLGAPDTIVSGLPLQGHASHNFVVDGASLYVNVGSRTNSCQQADRQKGSPGHDPCTELDTRAGIWRFDANRRGQTQADGRRFATGLRNSVALARNPANGRLYAAVHGRDQLFDNWAPLYTEQDNAEKPAEEFVQINENDNFGWPYCYYDPQLRMRVTAPEFGGDGRKSDRCGNAKAPLFGFPGHWAPNGLAFYSGRTFPAAYRNGAFIAFHGSWNRAPLPQAGFNVVFQPMNAAGQLTGAYTVFADGFQNADARTSPRVSAGHRPTGLAVGPDGALYVSDDLGGTIWRIEYRGVSKDR